MSSGAGGGAPVGQGVGGEFGSVVAADERRGDVTVDDDLLECGDGRVGVDGPVHDDGERFAGVLVDDVEQLDLLAVRGDVELEVQRPHMVDVSSLSASANRDRRLARVSDASGAHAGLPRATDGRSS